MHQPPAPDEAERNQSRKRNFEKELFNRLETLEKSIPYIGLGGSMVMIAKELVCLRGLTPI